MMEYAPFFVIVAMLGGAIAFGLWRKRVRRREFLAAAANLGFEEIIPGEGAMPIMGEMLLFERDGRYDVAAKGDWNGLLTCIFDYTMGRGRSEVTLTAASFLKRDTHYRIPVFQVRERHFADRLASFFTNEIVDVSATPDFKERFCVRSSDPDRAREFFTPAVCAFFEQLEYQHYTIEGCRDAVMVHVNNKRMSAGVLEDFVRRTGEVAQGLFSVVSSRSNVRSAS